MRCRSAGFTLVEMIVTVMVLAILTSIGMQTYQSVVTSTRMSGRINSLLGTFALARSEAMKRGQTVNVCPVLSPSAATAACTTVTDWTTGWVVLPTSAAPTPLQISTALTSGDTLTSTVNTFPVFSQTGYTFFAGILSLHDTNSTPSLYRCIVFSAGSWSTKKGAVCP